MMTPLDKITRSQPPVRMQRRFFMGGSAAALCTWMLGAPLLAQAAAAKTPAKEAFLKVSLILTGYAKLPPAQAERVYQALAAGDPAFSGQMLALQKFIAERKLNASSLQAALDSEQAVFAALPRNILQGWYVGVVGSGAQAKCIDYEEALMNLAVSDQLRPPSYAYGVYGSWGAQPVQTAGKKS
ncbi:MAG: sugar dehydrogenase complex small subunit [Collimonas sp.]|uniref:sugar dehydrogenase complex small subunit n=1 Tax=Collimonas sp. TaxID=1963772 RepID=UPI0032654F1B